MQQRLWLADRLEPGTLAYSLPILAFDLHGPLQVASLHQTLSDMERRHESLRTTFQQVEDAAGEHWPRQVIHPASERTLPLPMQMPLPVVDLHRLPPKTALELAEDLAGREGQRPFDLEAGPLWRCTLFRIKAFRVEAPRAQTQYHLLVILKHHIISDGWSLGVFYDEVNKIYDARRQGLPCPLPVPKLQYQDFARWQHEWLGRRELETELSFWRAQLQDAPMILPLPTDRPRPPAQTTHGKRIIHYASPRLEVAAVELQMQGGASLFMVILAAYQVLLYRLTGQRDLLVGSPAAGRAMPGSERMLGFFVNTIVLRGQLDPAQRFRDFLAEVRERVFAVYEHQALPFDRLVEALQPQRDLAYSPVYQAVFSLQNIEMPPLQLGEVTVDSNFVQNHVTQVDLILFTDVSTGHDASDRRSLSVPQMEFNTDLFDDTTIHRWLYALASLLEGFAADPDLPIGEASMLKIGERQQVLHEWVTTTPAAEGDLAADGTGAKDWTGTSEADAPGIAERIADHGTRVPDRIAVHDQRLHLSYGGLHRLALRLATEIPCESAKPEQPVALCVPGCAEQVLTQVTALYAGVPFLPLDPSVPVQRLLDMLRESRPVAVLVDAEPGQGASKNQGLQAELVAGLVVRKEQIWQRHDLPRRAANVSSSLSAPQRRPHQHLAYIVYTSGSSGRPKGNGISCGSYAARMAVRRHETPPSSGPTVCPSQRIAQAYGPGFDASLLGLGAPLTSGATVCVPPSSARLDPRLLRAWLERLGCSGIYGPTPMLEALLRDVPREPPGPLPTLACLRQLYPGGDRLHRDAAEYSRRLPHLRLINDYGPSETTILTTSGAVPRRAEGSHTRGTDPDIGRPLPGVRALLLDRRGHPVSLGCAGELCLGGSGVGRGYLHQPALTAGRFRPDGHAPAGPAAGSPGARLFHTGDLVRHLHDGRLEILGRADAQVKVRGFRVELEEIEAVLTEHPAVSAAAVVAERQRAGGPSQGDARLAAVFVTTGIAPETAELRLFLGQRLPDYMIPTVFLPATALPLTANGKLDRRALARRAAPELRAALEELGGGERPFTAPRTSLEAQLAALFVELLDVPRVSVRDNFFELGGHSLLATRLVAHIDRRLGRRLPMRTVFEAPTVADLAERLRRASSERRPPIGTQPRPADSVFRAPVSFAQQRLWFLDRLDPDNDTYNLPAAWRLRGALDPARLEAALDTVVARHGSLRTRFSSSRDRDPEQIVEPARPQPRRRLDLSRLCPTRRTVEAVRLATAWVRRPFDLTTAPLLRAVLVRLAADEHALLVSQHHIVSDGWSMGVLLADWAQAYRGEPLAPLPVQYVDYSQWQRAWLAGNELERQMQWWRQTLTNPNGTNPDGTNPDGTNPDGTNPDGTSPAASLPPPLELPTDRPRRSLQRFRGRGLAVHLPDDLSHHLHAFSQRRGLTPFMALLAGFAATAGRLAGAVDGRDDVVIGSPIAGRPLAELERLIGFFVNTLALRCRLRTEDDEGGRRELSFEQLVEQIRDTALGAYEHQDLPFEKLVEELSPQRDLSRTPLLQVSFALQDLPQPRVDFGGEATEALQLEPLPLDFHATHFDLEVHFQSRPGGGFSGAASYDADLFDATTVARWMRHYQALLSAGLEQPYTPVQHLEWLHASERHQLLHEWSSVAECSSATLQSARRQSARRQSTSRHDDLTLLPAFEAIVHRQPDSVAVVYGRLHLSYLQLDARARHQAARLRRQAATHELPLGPDVRVGLCFSRSPELIIAVLAVLHTGGAYLPLDPDDPVERQRFLLEDSGAVCVLGHPRHLDALELPASRYMAEEEQKFAPSTDESSALNIVAAQFTDSPAKTERISEQARADSLAYVIYTSGSTGRPKGAAIPHRAVHRLVLGGGLLSSEGLPGGGLPSEGLHGVPQTLPAAGERVALVANIAFDAATWELWAPLLTGGTIVGIRRRLQRDPARLARALRQQGVSNLFVLTSVLYQMQELAPDALAAITQVQYGAELVDPARIRRVLSESPGGPERLLHVYGPTENTTYTTAGRVRRVPAGARTVPIGRPLPHTHVSLLDRHGQPVPIGCAGELCAGGDGLARGYLGRPALTAERFVPDPASGTGSGTGTGGRRLYRTGDLVRWNPLGELEFIGRLDQQVKVRGVRVEPGETETVLAGLPQISEAAVVPIQVEGDTRLAAYIVPEGVVPEGDPSEDLDLDAIRQQLEAALSSHQVPAALVAERSLPHLPNGKLDRGSLRDRGWPGSTTAAYLAPRSHLEHTLCDIWQGLLGVERVGVRDDFFDLGGHSLLAGRVVTAIRDQIGVEVPLRAVFEAPTVAGLSVRVAREQAEVVGVDDLDDLLTEIEEMSEADVNELL